MAISDRIQAMYTHTSDIYDSVELTGVDTTDIDKNLVNVPNTLKEGYIDIINNGTDTLYNNFPKVSGEGTSLTLNNTYQAPMRNNLKGNTSQTGTPTPTSPIPVNVVSGDNEILINSKNFLKINDIAETTKNGMTYSCKDGVLTLNGTATSGVTIDFEYCLLPSGTYYISRNGTGTTSGSWQTYLRNNSSQIRQGEGSFTTTEGQYVYFRLYMNRGVVFTNYTLKPMINLGSTKIDFEPYQGNTYNIDLGNCLPNTYTPVEYIETSGTQYIDTGYQASGNLRVEGTVYTEQANTEMAICGVTYTTNAQLEIGFSSTNNRFFNYSGSVSAAVIPTESIYNKVFNFIAEVNDSSPKKKITLSVDNGISATNDANNGNYKANTITLFTVNNGFLYKGRLYKLDIYDNNVLKRRLVPCYRNSDNEIGLYDIVGNTFYTNLGTRTFTKGNDVENGIELCKIGTYQDYFYKDSGKWYLHKEIGKVVLNGSESGLSRGVTGTTGYYRWRVVLDNPLLATSTTTIVPLLCNRLANVTVANTYGGREGFAIDVVGNYAFFYIDETKTYSLDDMKVWLASNNLVVYYILATPTNTEVEYQPLIDQLNLLEKAMSKDGQTNISQINNDLGFIISASALKKG